MMFEDKVEMIWSALVDKKWRKGIEPHWYFILTMKATGHVIKVEKIEHGARRCMGHWNSGYTTYRVTGDGIEGDKFFKNFMSLARAIAAGFIK